MQNTAAIQRLREISRQRRELDAEESRIIDGLECGVPASSAPARQATIRQGWVTIATAEDITGLSRSSLYEIARKRPDIAHKLEVGGWRFLAEGLRMMMTPSA